MSESNEVAVAEVTTVVVDAIEKLDLSARVAPQAIAEKLNEVIDKLNSLTVLPKRDRGPTSTREMTDDDARRIMLGDLKDSSHKDAAEKLGLSYGQVYSARKGFTFKTIYQEMVKGPKSE